MEKVLSRDIKTDAYFDDDDKVVIIGRLIDDRHDIEVEMTFSYSGNLVTGIDKVIWHKTPYTYCKDIEYKINEIVGMEVKSGATKKINGILSGAEGCVHLAEVVLLIFKCFYQTKHRIEDKKLKTEEERMERKYKILKNVCYAYSEKFFNE